MGEVAILALVAGCGAAQAELALTVFSGTIAVLGMRLEAPMELIEKHAATIGLRRARSVILSASLAGAMMRCSAAYAAGAAVRGML